MRTPLHILFITGEYPPIVGGVGDYTQLLGRTLAARGHPVTVLTTQGGSSGSEGEPPVLCHPQLWSWRGAQVALRRIAQVKPDVIHIQYQTGAFNMHPAINLLPWRLRRRSRRPAIVVTAHDLRLPYLFPKADPLRRWVMTRLFADADALIVTNAADAAALTPGRPVSRELYRPARHLRTPIFTIQIGSNIPLAPPDGFTPARWRQLLCFQDDEVLIGYFGLISRTKGARSLIQAFARLPQTHRYRLVMIGGGETQPDDRRYAAEVKQMIAELGLDERVLLSGPRAPAQISGHLLTIDMMVLPFSDGASYRRGSLLAALVHGCPTITTAPATPLDPPLIDGEHALLVPSADPDLLAAAIVRVADDPVLRSRLRSGAQALGSAFSWPTIAAQHETVYHSVQNAVAKKAHA